MAVLYGFQIYNSPLNGVNFQQDVIGKNSEKLTLGDLVKISSGVLQAVANPTSTTEDPIGVIAGVTNPPAAVTVGTTNGLTSWTMGASNQTVQKVQPQYIPLDQDYIWIAGTNADLTGNATDGGTYYRVTGATGAQQVDVTNGVVTGTTRLVMIVAVDPLGVGGTGSGSGVRQCLVKFVTMANFRTA